MKNQSEGRLQKAASCSLEGHGHRTNSHDLVGSPQVSQEQTQSLVFTQTLLSMGMRLKAKWLELLPRSLDVGGG